MPHSKYVRRVNEAFELQLERLMRNLFARENFSFFTEGAIHKCMGWELPETGVKNESGS